jgi:hypothetical protein
MNIKKAKSTQCVLLKGYDESPQKEVGVKRRQSLLKGFDESPLKGSRSETTTIPFERL